MILKTFKIIYAFKKSWCFVQLFKAMRKIQFSGNACKTTEIVEKLKIVKLIQNVKSCFRKIS